MGSDLNPGSLESLISALILISFPLFLRGPGKVNPGLTPAGAGRVTWAKGCARWWGLRDDRRPGSSRVLSAGGVQARCQARSTHPLI